MTKTIFAPGDQAPSTAYSTPELYARYGFAKTELPNSCGMYLRIT